MTIVDVGTGPPLVLIPGIQGRWEWMKPAVDALARYCRVITFSLVDEPSCDGSFDAVRGFDCYVDQVGAAMDQAGISSATVCGVSYGGLIAATFAARHPDRTAGLILVSAVPPSWKPDRRVRFYLRAPRLLSPVFSIASVRLYKEIAAATPGVFRGIRAAFRHATTVLTHLFSPTLMARRAQLLDDIDLTSDVRRARTPVLVITGEPQLDRVVPVHRTREYLDLWPHARAATLSNTGHLGSITRPEAFADLVVPFVAARGLSAPSGKPDSASPTEARRRVV
jgi:pimeloyl-ACP methyl ester carboxylesterase